MEKLTLTNQQQEMLTACLEVGAAWTTAVGSPNDDLLSGWVDRGWAQRVEPPAGLHSLASYCFTPAGRAALEASNE